MDQNRSHQWSIYGSVIISGFWSRYSLIFNIPLFAVLVMKYGFILTSRIFFSFCRFSAVALSWLSVTARVANILKSGDKKAKCADTILIANPIIESHIKICIHVGLCIASDLKWIFTPTRNNFRMEPKKMLKCFCSTFFETSDDDMRQLFCQSILKGIIKWRQFNSSAPIFLD